MVTTNFMVKLVASVIGAMITVFIVLIVIVLFVIPSYQDSQRYAEVRARQDQLSLLPVPGKPSGGSAQSSRSYGDAGLNSTLYIDDEYTLASAPSNAAVESYYRSQLEKRGWLFDQGSSTTLGGAKQLVLDFYAPGKHGDTLKYTVNYALSTKDLSVEIESNPGVGY